MKKQLGCLGILFVVTAFIAGCGGGAGGGGGGSAQEVFTDFNSVPSLDLSSYDQTGATAANIANGKAKSTLTLIDGDWSAAGCQAYSEKRQLYNMASAMDFNRCMVATIQEATGTTIPINEHVYVQATLPYGVGPGGEQGGETELLVRAGLTQDSVSVDICFDGTLQEQMRLTAVAGADGNPVLNGTMYHG